MSIELGWGSCSTSPICTLKTLSNLLYCEWFGQWVTLQSWYFSGYTPMKTNETIPNVMVWLVCWMWLFLVPSGKLTCQWKMDLLKMYSLLNMGIFHCHVSLLECIWVLNLWGPVLSRAHKLLPGTTDWGLKTLGIQGSCTRRYYSYTQYIQTEKKDMINWDRINSLFYT